MVYDQNFWDNKWPKAPIVYRGRALIKNKTQVAIDVKDFITPNDNIVLEIVRKFGLKKPTPNETAWTVQKWVAKFLTYKYDSEYTDCEEFWMFPFESLQSKIGDCEDGAILIATLCIAAGIPAWRIKVAAGFVQEAPTAPTGGHAYCIYLADRLEQPEKLGWVILDWCIVDNKRTLIQTPNGSKRISKLKEGDWIMGFDEANKKPQLTQIKKIGNREVNEVYKIDFEKGNSIYVTGEHPFYIRGEWKRADSLAVDDEVYFVNPKSLYHMFHKHKEDEWRKEAHKKVTQKLYENGTYAATSKRQKENNVFTWIKVREKLSKNNAMKRPEVAQKSYTTRTSGKITNPEKNFLEYCKENNLPVEYVGDGKFWLKTKNGSINPDFKVSKENKFIEVSSDGFDYYRNWEEYKSKRKNILEGLGKKVLFVLFKKHSKNIIEPSSLSTINEFVLNGNKIKKITKVKNKNKTVWNMHCEPFNNYFVNGNLVHNCFYEDSTWPVEKKPLAKDGGYQNMYKSVWWTFNNQFSWNQTALSIEAGRVSQDGVVGQAVKEEKDYIAKVMIEIEDKVGQWVI